MATSLVIGADGLLGSHLVRKLLARGDSVRVLVQPNSTSPTLEGLSIDRITGDLLDGADSLSEAARGCDTVYNLAAITDMWAPKDLTWHVNFDGSENLADACQKVGVHKLVFCGSASSYQFGTMENPADETSPFPNEYKNVAYMESKYKAMMRIKERVANGELDAVIVGPTFMLGNLDWRPSSGELARQFIVKRMSVTSPGGRNFAYAPDVADTLIAASEKGRPGESYIAGGHNWTYMQFFSEVARQAGIEPPKKTVSKPVLLLVGMAGSLAHKLTGKPVALNYTMSKLALCGTYYSSAKAERELGMTHVSMEQAIGETIASLREFGHIE